MSSYCLRPQKIHERAMDGHELNFVEGKDDIEGNDEIDLRVELPCGHTAAPSSVFQWCRFRLDLGYTRFHCPATAADGTDCNKEWKLAMIQRVALHTEEGQEGLREFEEKMATLTAKQCCEYKRCPGCESLVEREDLSNMRVLCTICTAATGRNYEFCWQCLKPWKGDAVSSVGCERKDCKNYNLEILLECKVFDLPYSEIKSCPSIRACPTCGLLIEHKELCKYILCTRCSVEFCFACLETAEACQRRKPESNFMVCAKPLAPKQTAIPLWCRPTQHATLLTGGDEEFQFERLQSFWRDIANEHT